MKPNHSTQGLENTRSMFAIAPGELDSVRGQLQRAESERSSNSAKQRGPCRVNEALRPAVPNTAPSITATDPHLLTPSFPVLRMVNSRFERTDYEPIPFSAIQRASAQRFTAEHQATRATAETLAKAMTAAKPSAPSAMANTNAYNKRPHPDRLQRFADRHLTKGHRAELLLVVTVFLLAAVSVAAFYIQHHTPGA